MKLGRRGCKYEGLGKLQKEWIGNWDGGAYTCGEGERVTEDHRWERIGLVLTVALKSNEKDGKDSGGDTGANK
jgi:hypothetical protein